MTPYYILDERGNVRAVDDVLVWAGWLEHHDRRVALTEVVPGTWVSTVFLGIDHNWSSVGPPVVFETMVWTEANGKRRFWDDIQERYCTRAEALAGHKQVCEQVRVAGSGTTEGY